MPIDPMSMRVAVVGIRGKRHTGTGQKIYVE